jgi:hypothetical protein
MAEFVHTPSPPMSTMTNDVSSYLTHDHRRCDHLLAVRDTALDKGEWKAAEDGVWFGVVHSFRLDRLDRRRHHIVLHAPSGGPVADELS